MFQEYIPFILEKLVYLDGLFGKWFLLILVTISMHRTVNFYNLSKDVGEITPKVLSSKLKSLEEMGLIGKRILSEKPKRVEYCLTKKGKKFLESMSRVFPFNFPFMEKNPQNMMPDTEKSE